VASTPVLFLGGRPLGAREVSPDAGLFVGRFRLVCCVPEAALGAAIDLPVSLALGFVGKRWRLEAVLSRAIRVSATRLGWGRR